MTDHLFWKATILGGLYRGVPLFLSPVEYKLKLHSRLICYCSFGICFGVRIWLIKKVFLRWDYGLLCTVFIVLIPYVFCVQTLYCIANIGFYSVWTNPEFRVLKNLMISQFSPEKLVYHYYFLFVSLWIVNLNCLITYMYFISWLGLCFVLW